ncbi:MAG: glycoside hydrolase N-terminal domain-containing protein [Bacteroidetes bacterium]|nr:glycoside hydrolase N-terminal domain-containing protein [Bacteroidota bacterium]MBS1931035.1 glycoside hydrolase N-terminal domain-containing protein [Bacteroidota bacterium]
MKQILVYSCFFIFSSSLLAQSISRYDLHFDSLAKRWDEAMPLGNGWLGALIWQKDDKLRMSLDRVDLWDDRPMPEINQLTFKWVAEKVKLNQYDSVQKIGDEPYKIYPAPTKIPGAALEFDINSFGKVVSNELDIEQAICRVRWDSGVELETYVCAQSNHGVFIFRNVNDTINIQIIPPPYHSGKEGVTGNTVEGQGLESLGYQKGNIVREKNFIQYYQPCNNGTSYTVTVSWHFTNHEIRGKWHISKTDSENQSQQTESTDTTLASHVKWWKDYWNRSSVSLPDSILERQYYLDMYKFGCVARSNTPPISLQAVWTADNGNLPPWKGDIHNDLNTELSYWPGYVSNHLDLTASFTNWLWKVKNENKKWTKHYFETDGLNVPGVATISGKPMGGWIQYSMSPTTVAWLSQNFYWQWKYSLDTKFLKERCLPYFKEIEKYLSGIRIRDNITGKYKLPISSSPEYHDNSIHAWFSHFTNYDLSLIKYFYLKYGEILKIQNPAEANQILSEERMYPGLDVNETGLSVAPGQDLEKSHRHLSQYMSIFPLGILNFDNEKDKEIISKSIRWIEEKGTRNWCGYTFSWMGSIYAKINKGNKAAEMLRDFAANFCSINSFHLNGDQKGGHYSSFTYRPFTLEGNFAFARGIQEMLIRSDRGYIEIFPAVPDDWLNVSFKTFRTEGAFLVSAQKENGVVKEIIIKSEAGGRLNIKLPFKNRIVTGVNAQKVIVKNEIASVHVSKGSTVIFRPANE